MTNRMSDDQKAMAYDGLRDAVFAAEPGLSGDPHPAAQWIVGMADILRRMEATIYDGMYDDAIREAQRMLHESLKKRPPS